MSYLFFHLLILGSLGISKLFYSEMKFVSLNKFMKIYPVVIFFIIWDFVVTGSWWTFNPKFVHQLNALLNFKIPYEEVLFFIVVPFALLSLLENLKLFIKSDRPIIKRDKFRSINYSLKLVIFIFVIFFYISQLWYSFFIMVLLLVTDFYPLIIKHFALGAIFTIMTTLFFNYYLTSLPIVMYDAAYKTNLLIGTIPIEDFGYGLLLYLWIVRCVYGKK